MTRTPHGAPIAHAPQGSIGVLGGAGALTTGAGGVGSATGSGALTTGAGSTTGTGGTGVGVGSPCTLTTPTVLAGDGSNNATGDPAQAERMSADTPMANTAFMALPLSRRFQARTIPVRGFAPRADSRCRGQQARHPLMAAAFALPRIEFDFRHGPGLSHGGISLQVNVQEYIPTRDILEGNP